MDTVSLENLRSFLLQIRNAGLSERIFSWRRIQSQGENALAEYQQLTSRIREMEQETETRKGELVRLGEELRAAAETHENAIRKLNLNSNITRHDVRNLLVALDGYIEFTESRVSDPNITPLLRTQREIVQKIQHQIDFTRSYQDIGVHRPSWQNVRECIGKTVATIQPQGVSVTVNCPPDLEILADRMLERVFATLLDNSLRYGERVKAIRVSSHNDGSGFVITWEDDGVGIAPDEKEKIFVRRPHQFDLFLSREVLEITGITIRETGTYGKGARFEMRVPEGAFRFSAGSNPGPG
jgi:signal transduction histidine kinase